MRSRTGFYTIACLTPPWLSIGFITTLIAQFVPSIYRSDHEVESLQRIRWTQRSRDGWLRMLSREQPCWERKCKVRSIGKMEKIRFWLLYPSQISSLTLSSQSNGRCKRISRGSVSAAMIITSAIPLLRVFVAVILYYPWFLLLFLPSFAPFLSCL